MPAPTINEDYSHFTIASGFPLLVAFTASETPTSWAISGLPSGAAAINNSTGVATINLTVTEPAAYTASVTATNATGTSEASTFLVVILPAPAGGTQNDFDVPIDFDVIMESISIPGLGVPVRLSTPDLDNESAGPEAGFLGKNFYVGERYKILAGMLKYGVLQDADVDVAVITFKQFNEDAALTIGEGDFTEISTSTSRRYATTIYLDPDIFTNIVAEGSRARRGYVVGTLQIALGKVTDDRGFTSALGSETIATLDQGDTHNDTFAITIPAEIEDAIDYELTLTLVVPGAPTLGAIVTQTMSLTYNGAAYVLNSQSGDTSAEGVSIEAADWDTTLSLTSLTATATGISVGSRVVTDAQVSAESRLVIDLRAMEISGSALVDSLGLETWDIRDSMDNTIFTWEPQDGDGAAEIAADFLTGASETVTVELDAANDIVRILLPSGTSILTAVSDQGGANVVAGPEGLGPSYSNALVTASLRGLAMADKTDYRISHTPFVRIYQPH